MILRELKPSQQVEGRWLGVLEDGTLLRVGESEVLSFDLYAGRNLTEEELEALNQSTQRSERKMRAIELAASKPMSRKQLADKLAQWGAEEEESAALCDRLEELGYLNDEAYAAQVVGHYGGRGYGPGRIREELRRRGVPRELWAQALDGLEGQAETIDAFLEKKCRGRLPTDRKEWKRLSDALARRGFSWSDISDALARYGARCEEFEDLGG